MTRSRRPPKFDRHTAACCGDILGACMCHTKKPPLYLRKAPTVAEFDPVMNAQQWDAFEQAERVNCEHGIDSFECGMCDGAEGEKL